MSSEDRTYSEKRNFIRMRINTPVQVRCGDREIEAVGKDLSGSGMLLLFQEELAPGTSVEIRIEQEKDRAPFRASAEVTRVHETTDEGYLLGLSITQIHD